MIVELYCVSGIYIILNKLAKFDLYNCYNDILIEKGDFDGENRMYHLRL